MSASVRLVSIGLVMRLLSPNDLSHVQRHVICTSAGVLSIRLSRTRFSERKKPFFTQKNAFEKVVCYLAVFYGDAWMCLKKIWHSYVINKQLLLRFMFTLLFNNDVIAPSNSSTTVRDMGKCHAWISMEGYCNSNKTTYDMTLWDVGILYVDYSRMLISL